MVLSPDVLVVFGLIGVALVLFVTETFPPDVTAIGLLVSLVLLQPWTHITAPMAIQGFANPATVTIIGMYILSEGIRRTGIVTRLSHRLTVFAAGNERRLLGGIVGTTGISAGFINNTPIVAVFIPMVTDLADELGISPSKLLLPLSYAAMLGGTLTLLGTATNVLVSEFATELLGRPITMFEFTPLGVVVLGVGLAYLLTVGRWLTPARVGPGEGSIESFELDRHLARLVVKEDSLLVGRPVESLRET
ncbi:MAG: SLC13 family permease, partial [Halodesulfurarchaeum sp.]